MSTVLLILGVSPDWSVVASFDSPWKAADYAAWELGPGTYALLLRRKSYPFSVARGGDGDYWTMPTDVHERLRAACPRRAE